MAEYGPCLPAHLSGAGRSEPANDPSDQGNSDSDDAHLYGPALPKALQSNSDEKKKKKKKKEKKHKKEKKKEKEKESRSIGPALPPPGQDFSQFAQGTQEEDVKESDEDDQAEQGLYPPPFVF